MHPNQSPKAEVSDKPDAWLVTANGATLGVSIHPPGSLPVGTHSLVEFVPLYRRATDDKVLALVEALTQILDSTFRNALQLRAIADAALAGVKEGK